MTLADKLNAVRCVNDAAKLAPVMAKAAGVSVADALEFIRRKRGVHATIEDVRRVGSHVPTWTTDSRGGRWQDRMQETHGHMPNFERMARGRF
jgi:hypothetical protein